MVHGSKRPGHAWATLGAFVPHDEHVALTDAPGHDGFIRSVLLVETTRRAAVVDLR